MASILVVEDHANLRQSLETCLSSEGFEVTAVADLASAREAIARAPDLIVLDWMLPDGQGIDLLADLRAKRIPVILLTARAETVDKVLGLELGASDYVTKPFEPRELVARVRARIREAGPAVVSAILRVGPLTIDRERREVRCDGVAVDLVKKEFDLLLLFAENPGKVFSRDEILNKVWGYDVYPTTRTVDTHVLWLRQKTREDLIQTIRSVGYKLSV